MISLSSVSRRNCNSVARISMFKTTRLLHVVFKEYLTTFSEKGMVKWVDPPNFYKSIFLLHSKSEIPYYETMWLLCWWSFYKRIRDCLLHNYSIHSAGVVMKGFTQAMRSKKLSECFHFVVTVVRVGGASVRIWVPN